MAPREAGGLFLLAPQRDKIMSPHHTHMIPKGLPGEGNILVYDNGGWADYGPPNDMAPNGINNIRRYYTRVIEFDPITKKIVWEYSRCFGALARSFPKGHGLTLGTTGSAR